MNVSRIWLSTLFGFCLLWSCFAYAVEPVATLQQIEGEVLVNRGADYVEGVSGASLSAGDGVVVLENARAVVVQGECVIDLEENSLYTVLEFLDCDAAKDSVVRVDPFFYPGVAGEEEAAVAAVKPKKKKVPTGALIGGGLLVVGGGALLLGGGGGGGGGGDDNPPPISPE